MGSSGPHIAIIIPAFNEEESIRSVVTAVWTSLQILGMRSTIIVVNDGSVDGTAAAALSLPCTLLNLPINLGIGGAVQLGFRYALELGCDAAVQVDGDGQHPTHALGRLLQPLIDDAADVVIGSRFLSPGGSRSTFGRRIGIRYFNALQGLLIGRRISDSTSGFRAVNRKVIALCAEEYPDQYPEPESIVAFTTWGLRITEVAVDMVERQGGVSSIGVFAGFVYMVKVTIAMIMAVLKTHKKG